MKRLFYAGGSVVIEDRTCKAILRYARALARAGQSDVVSVPVVSEQGVSGFGHFVLGPASQLFSAPVASLDADSPAPVRSDPVQVDEAVDDLEARGRRLAPTTAEWPDELDDIRGLGDDFL